MPEAPQPVNDGPHPQIDANKVTCFCSVLRFVGARSNLGITQPRCLCNGNDAKHVLGIVFQLPLLPYCSEAKGPRHYNKVQHQLAIFSGWKGEVRAIWFLFFRPAHAMPRAHAIPVIPQVRYWVQWCLWWYTFLPFCSQENICSQVYDHAYVS